MLQNKVIFFTTGLVLLLMAFADTSGAQTLGGFMGLTWHDEMEHDKSIMSQLPGVQYDSTTPCANNLNLLSFSNVKWENFQTSKVLLIFCPEGLFQAWAEFSSKPHDATKLFMDLEKKLDKKYGKSKKSHSSDLIMRTWEFDEGNHITLGKNNSAGNVVLTFINKEMTDDYMPTE